MAHRTHPWGSGKWDKTSTCEPLRTAVCANLKDSQGQGPLLFLLMWGLLCFPFLLHPACAPQEAFHPQGRPSPVFGAILQGHLEERSDDLGGSPDPVPIATVWLKISGSGRASLAHPSRVDRPTLEQLPRALSSCLDSFLSGLYGGRWVGAEREGGWQKLPCVGRRKTLLDWMALLYYI